MFQKFFGKKSVTKKVTIINTPKISKILNIDQTTVKEKESLENNEYEELKAYFLSICEGREKRTQYLQAIMTTQTRTRDLKETKEIVTDLREVERTSQEALSFLEEKIQLVKQEKERLRTIFSQLYNDLLQNQIMELEQQIERTINQMSLIDTSEWEGKLDHIRNRFLMQKEQETDMNEQKEKVIQGEEKKTITDLKMTTVKKTDSILKNTLLLNFTAQQAKELLPCIENFETLAEKTPSDLMDEVFESPQEALDDRINEQIKMSSEIGQELFTLKKEQAILTLNTYEMVQTVKSRTMNIGGFMAERSFFNDNIKELLSQSQNGNLSYQEKKEKLLKTVQYFLQILE